MATTLWLLLYGYYSMATTLWLLLYGYYSMATTLWLLLYGYYSMATTLWLRRGGSFRGRLGATAGSGHIARNWLGTSGLMGLMG
jgi:hypothetical protein